MPMIVLLCMSIYLASSTVQSKTSEADDLEYGIILDAGSSGTKLKIYTWDTKIDRKSRDTFKYDLTLMTSLKFPPGIGTKANKLSAVPMYLAQIIETAKSTIPDDKHATTPLYFLATAGLRIYPVNTTDQLLDTVEAYLRDSQNNPFLVPARAAVRVISGEEEAMYAWVTTNYLNDFFWSNRPPTQALGVLEMGGGSTQIAFLPDHSVYANMFPVQIGGITYHLYAHSYLFYGQNYILERINNYLIEMSLTDNPCMLSGDNATVTAFGKSVLINGSGNVTKCLEIIDFFLKSADDKWCHPKPCAIGHTYQPSVSGIVFYAIAAFQYAPKYLNAVNELGKLNLTLLQQNAEIYCKKTLKEVVDDKLPAAYASPYCTMGLYIPRLLMGAYGFSASDTVYIKPSIGNVEIDWAMGAMLLVVEESNDVTITCSVNSCHLISDAKVLIVFVTLVMCLVSRLLTL